jgi:predicted acetyltransferase
MRRDGGPTYRAVLEVDGQPRGYTIHRIKASWTDRGPENRLMVQEVTALDADAEQRLWQWISAIDLVSTITLWRGPVPHPLQLWLQEPRRLGLTTIDGLWLRILDLPAALAARTYAGEGTVVLEVTDALIDSNAGRWQLTARGDEPASVERTTAEPDLAIDIGSLASAYLGAFRLADLARAGHVRELHRGALRTADVLFTSPNAPFSNTMF